MGALDTLSSKPPPAPRQGVQRLSPAAPTYPVEQQEHSFPVYSRRLRSDALVPLMPLAAAKRRVVERVVILLDDA